MPFNPAQHKADTLAHYCTLAAKPAYKAYVWHQVQHLAKQCPALYGDLPKLLTQAMTSPPPSPDGKK